MATHPCPCCDYLTLDERGLHDICPVCFWQDSGLDRPDEPSGCNRGLTLRQARANFRRLGACEPEMVRHVCSPEERRRYRLGSGFGP